MMIIRNLSFALLIVFIANYKVNCAMKKSWKSAANFDADIPKFTPFGTEEKLKEKDSIELKVETTQSPPSPSPSAETLPLVSRLSSKIKAPPQNISDVYNFITKETDKKTNIELNMAQDSEEDLPLKSYSEAQHEADRNQIDISQILSDLMENADESTTTDEPEDEIEIHENEATNSTEYKVGSLLNVTVVDDDSSKDSLVNVNVDQNTLKRIFTGRGRKNGLLERVVPLFILPFLIQSAFVPFIVTMIKLFLMKSLFAGKIAVLLLLLGALKNHQNGMYMKSMQHNPYNIYKDYPSPFPERRIETSFDGYKVEGKPNAVIN